MHKAFTIGTSDCPNSVREYSVFGGTTGYNTKVDREERPDIDSVYMSVCQTLTGSGGWPMSIFMSWDKKPFFAGTYFPPQDSFGRIGFTRLLAEIVDLWEQAQEKLLRSADCIINKIKDSEQAQDTKTANDIATGL